MIFLNFDAVVTKDLMDYYWAIL